ncbi:Mur ligase family protein [Xylophilus sp.]|uniref:Mur ligase family protein n=1 Tax=Xylophilus sp. TaxID=2653893 RepID=UPI0013B92503|nr:UDP-N-acetylmuramoyl-L-alanine--D-glutamate ligase [Xylophilus sp.]KAF1048956.1 MAG: UDP-N-acetylmuramoylalanine--D-glutamate ligase [Xylophilus sp.]
MKHLQDLPVLILGLGASGLAMARWCARHGAQVTVADTREDPPQRAALARDVPGAAFVGGPFTPALVEGTTVRAVYRSPGLSPAVIAPVADAARAIGLPVGGELDLFARALADLREADGAAAEAEEGAGEYRPIVSEESGLQDDIPEGMRNGPDAVALPAPEPGYRPAVLAITGTNGKTTVTALTGQLVARAGKTVAVAGNIGPTLLDTLAARIDAGTLPEVWVLELSSFQLDGVQGFEPTAAAVLNVTQDHLDWHGDIASYAAAKARIFGERGLLVLNREDDTVMAMLPPPGRPKAAAAPSGGSEARAAASVGARGSPSPVKVKWQKPRQRPCVTFGTDLPQRPGDYGIENVNGMAWLVRALEADETRRRKDGPEDLHIQRLMPADALRIRGRHNAANALAALALAHAAGCPLAPMLFGLREYRGEPHRVEPLAVIDEVEYFDDSKGTNVGATVAALTGLGAERRIVAILGGDGKGQDFAPLAAPVARHARAVVLIGRDAPQIRAALEDAGVPLLDAATLEEAVRTAAGRAQAGDAVLLSPACASFDMFTGYEHRARVFAGAVQALADAAGLTLESTP